MKKVLSLFMLAGAVAIAACGPSEADKKLADQKRTDSLLEVENKRLQEEAAIKEAEAQQALKEAQEDLQEAKSDLKEAKADVKDAKETKQEADKKVEETKTSPVTKGGQQPAGTETKTTETKVTKGGKKVE